MIEPTVGRVVLYHPAVDDPGGMHLSEPTKDVHAAIICYVWDNTSVNLAVFDSNGVPYARTSIYLLQEGNERPVGPYCEWMPYQLGQAKKTEEAQAKLADFEVGARVTRR